MSFSDQSIQRAKKCVKQKKYSQALALYHHVLETNPQDKFALKQYNKLCDLEEKELKTLHSLFEQGKFEDAYKKCHITLQKFPESPRLLNFKGGLANRLGLLQEAVSAYKKTLDIIGYDTNVLINLGIAYRYVQEIKKSTSCFDAILAKEPNHHDAAYSLGFTYLLNGEYEKGWKYYESRWNATFSTSAPRNFKQPMWDGNSLEGKRLLVHCEQGYGDTFQFIRFLPLLKKYNGLIIFETPKALEPLMFNFDVIDELVIRGDDKPDFDVHIPLLSIPYVLNLGLSSISSHTPYIKGDGIPFDGLRLSPEKLNVGFVWTGSETFRHNHFRSMVFNEVKPLLDSENCKFHSLQVCENQESIADLLRQNQIQDLGTQFKNFLDTVRAIDQLDLIVTTDTAVAHLAGAMGKKTWILLHYTADFRWLLNREDSPWYPTARLYRQKELGNWKDVLNKVLKDLQQSNV
ncbi:tetratricopeptide repeat protein [Terasakiella pusilla]|uniref:tetratricopeptide repeat protein n=1 Tax=Terasakiella pusilla TaxID=64973 RepID=UPI003AA85A8B